MNTNTAPTSMSTRRSFEERVALLSEFASVNGSLPRRPADDVPPAEGDLGRIVNRFRDSYRLGKLTDAQVALVETIPGWVWHVRGGVVELMGDPKWYAKARKVKAFAEKHGRIPLKHNAGMAERRLAEWCRTQRTLRTDTRYPLSDAKKTYLEALPGWFWERESAGARWQERYEEVAAYVARTGSLPYRHKTKKQDRETRSLGDWVLTQRSKMSNSMLPPHTPAQVAALELIPGWTWPSKRSAQWEERVADLVAYLNDFGTMPKAESAEPDEMALGRWVQSQWVEYNSGRMARQYPERIPVLEAVDGWKWEFDKLDSWLLSYAGTFAYAIEHGKLPSMKSSDPDIRKLGTWAGHMRRSRTPGKTFMAMTPGREAALELIPGWYWTD